VRVVHEEGDAVLATHVEVVDSLFETFRGLRLRRSLPADGALVFRFGSIRQRDVDMLLVTFPIDVLWLVDGRVERVDTLRAWFDLALARADTLVELPAGTAAGVSPGDAVRIEE